MNRRASFSNSRMTYSSSRYESYDQANSYFRNNRSALSNNLVKEKLNTALYEANADINNNFGFRPLTENTFLWLLDSKKHPEYETMQAKWVTLKPILKSVQAGSMSEAQRSAISDMITYLEGVKKTYIKDEKGDRKMRYAAYYNSAKLYLFLDEPEKAIEQAELLILNEYDEKDGKHLKEQAERMIELFTKNNIRTRHFVIDLSDAKAPG
jgi:hypothetical protein